LREGSDSFPFLFRETAWPKTFDSGTRSPASSQPDSTDSAGRRCSSAAIFRGDLITGVIVLILSASSFWLVAIIWAFLYNRVYTTRLLERGYVFDDDPEKVREAKRALRIQE